MDRVAGAPRLYPATNVAVPTTANAILRQIDSTGPNHAARVTTYNFVRLRVILREGASCKRQAGLD